MARKDKGRGGDYRAITYAGYLHLPHVLTAEPDFISLSGHALKLLIDVARQYNGKNNGDLCCAMTVLKGRGWKSNCQLLKAKRELIAKNLLMETRPGGLGIGPTLYAITWQPINECPGKGLVVGPTLHPPRLFRPITVSNSNLPHREAVQAAPCGGALKVIFVTSLHRVAVTFIYLPCIGSVLWQSMPLLLSVIAP
jgi:hypothetical protein